MKRPTIDLEELQELALTAARGAKIGVEGGARKHAIRLLAEELDKAVDLPGILEAVDGPVFELLAGIIVDSAIKKMGQGDARKAGR